MFDTIENYDKWGNKKFSDEDLFHYLGVIGKGGINPDFMFAPIDPSRANTSIEAKLARMLLVLKSAGMVETKSLTGNGTVKASVTDKGRNALRQLKLDED